MQAGSLQPIARAVVELTGGNGSQPMVTTTTGDGKVVNANREPVTNATVVLVPDTAYRQRMDLYKSVATDDSGRFQLKGIAPGQYSVFAWEDIDVDLWRDSEFIRRNEAEGRPVHISEGAHENIELVAIPLAF